MLSIKPSFCIILILSFYGSADAFAKRKALMNEIPSIRIVENLSIAKIDDAVRIALLDQNWRPISYKRDLPREILATLNVQTHALTIKLQYDSDFVSIEYVDSINLRYVEEDGKRYIHSAYKEWTQWLSDNIKENLDSEASLGKISEACFTRMLQTKDTLPINRFKKSRVRIATQLCSDRPLRIIVSDKRPYVLSGEKSPRFAGLKRHYGVPRSVEIGRNDLPSTIPKGVDVTTSEMVAEGLKLVLAGAIPQVTAKDLTGASALSETDEQRNGQIRLLSIEINEWKYDYPGKGMGKTAFHYDLKATLSDKKVTDKTITQSIKGKRIVKSIKAMQDEHAWVYEQLFRNTNLAAALTTFADADRSVIEPQPVATIIKAGESENSTTPKGRLITDTPTNTTASTCSVAQILKMSELGLSGTQIEAACANKREK